MSETKTKCAICGLIYQPGDGKTCLGNTAGMPPEALRFGKCCASAPTDQSEASDGGPAFPLPIIETRDGAFETTNVVGISVLDWYAGHALAGLLASESNVNLAACRKTAAAENGLSYTEQLGIEVMQIARDAIAAKGRKGDGLDGD